MQQPAGSLGRVYSTAGWQLSLVFWLQRKKKKKKEEGLITLFKVYKLNASPLLSNSLSYIVTKGSCWVEAELFLYNRICPQA